MNVAKIALILIFLLLLVVIFFALTGLDVNNPMPAIERMLAWVVRLNRTLNVMMRNFMLSIQNSLRETFQ
jgi:hypothetical protein